MAEILTAIFKTFFAKGVSILWENKNTLSLYFKTLFWTYRNKEIRFSISYLFRIRIPNTNSYLLVLNRRIDNQLQPVGGVYKRYGDDKLFEKWGYMPDNKRNGLDVDEESSEDLRFKIKGKHVIDVIKWFEEGKEREVSANREFCEELLKPGILDSHAFGYIKYKHVKRVSKNLKWSDHFSCYEVLIYDVLELMPNEAQKKQLSELADESVDLAKGYAIVNFDDIEQLRFVRNNKQIARIGEHTRLTINKD